jgi:NAD(P)H dehydrogenase (quinone)
MVFTFANPHVSFLEESSSELPVSKSSEEKQPATPPSEKPKLKAVPGGLSDKTTQRRAKKILLVMGHPNPKSYCARLADAFESGVSETGAVCKRLNIIDLDFDPILRTSQATAQPLEPDLENAQKLIAWADHLVFVYPTWWGTTPALLKGFLDRVLIQGFAFAFKPEGLFWDKLLRGKTAEIITTMNTPPWVSQWLYRDIGIRVMTQTVFDFCGIRSKRVTRIGMIRKFTPEQLESWLGKVKNLGRKLP